MGTFCNKYHFRELTKMIIHIDFQRLTGHDSSAYRNNEMVHLIIKRQVRRASLKA